MKFFTDKDDIGLIDGLIIFLSTLYIMYKIFIVTVVTRAELSALALVYLYGIILWVRAVNIRKRTSLKFLENFVYRSVKSEFYDEDTFAGLTFVTFVELALGILILYSLMYSVGGTKPFGLFNRIYLFGYDLHVFTFVCILISFYVHWRALSYLYPLKRFVVNLAITAWHTYFGAVLWTTFSVIYRQRGFWYMPYLGLVFLTTLLFALDKRGGFIKQKITKEDKTSVSFIVLIQVGALFLLSTTTDFWIAMNLSDMNMGPDPNISGFWLVWKIYAFMILYPIVAKYDLVAPKRMDSVII